jgi:hypothetical protein
MDYYDKLKEYPVLDAGIGCSSNIPPEAQIYGCIYNREMYKLLKCNRKAEPAASGYGARRTAPKC